MLFPFGEPVIQTPRVKSGVNSLGDDIYSDSTPISYPSCGVAPRDGNSTSGNENTGVEEQIVTGLTVFLPAGAVVSALDKFTVRGVQYEVDGQPESLLNPFTGWNPGLPVSLKRVTG